MVKCLTQTPPFMKIRPVGAQVVPRVQTDRRTDMMKLMFVFRNFANAPRNAAYQQTLRELFHCYTECRQSSGSVIQIQLLFSSDHY